MIIVKSALKLGVILVHVVAEEETTTKAFDIFGTCGMSNAKTGYKYLYLYKQQKE